MKTKTILLFFLIITLLSACKKYEYGPEFTLQTKTKRLCRKWLYDSYIVNGVEYKVTGRVTQYYKKGGYCDYLGSTGGQPTWDFRNHKKEILMSWNDGYQQKTLVILKLTEEEFWYTIENNNVIEERHFVADN